MYFTKSDFISSLSTRIFNSSSPSKRCWTRKEFYDFLGSLNPKVPSSKKREVVEELYKIGKIKRIPVDSEKETNAYEFFIWDTLIDRVTPIELLAAFNPDGVICYFSALSYFELTTQIPRIWHIAKLRKPSNSVNKQQKVNTQAYTSTKKPLSLGVSIGNYENNQLMITHRNYPGTYLQKFQKRVISPYLSINITTLEQTLIDTLHHPVACGGLEVVEEAWENGLEELNESKLFDLLNNMKSSVTNRRVGAIYDWFETTPQNKDLKNHLLREKESINSESHPAQLFYGMDFHKLNTTWGILTP